MHANSAFIAVLSAPIRMKHLKSTLSDLRQLFDQGITIGYLACNLTSFEHNSDSSVVLSYMEEHDFDVVGVRSSGKMIGYVRRADLLDSESEKYLIRFDISDVVSESTPLALALRLLRDRARLFVLSRDEVSGIVTRGDFQKAPARMWLFGLISLLEMQLLRIIRVQYPNDSWTELLTPARLEYARNVLAERAKRNEAIDLADCLQFSDKKRVVVKSSTIRKELGIDSKSAIQKLLEEVERLRDNLAHSQDIITGFWPGIVELADNIEALLERCERLGVNHPSS